MKPAYQTSCCEDLGVKGHTVGWVTGVLMYFNVEVDIQELYDLFGLVIETTGVDFLAQ